MNQKLISKCLIYGDRNSNAYKELLISENLSKETKDVLNGNYVNILNNDLFLCLYEEFGNLSKSNFRLNITKHLSRFLELNPLESNTIFIIGIACYQLFIQANWTGPLLSNLDLKSWGTSTEVIESLVDDLDCVSKKVLYPELLVFSYAVFNVEQFDSYAQPWWQIRMLSTLQSLLNGLSNDIKKIIDKAFEKMNKFSWDSYEEEALFRLEQCKVYVFHYSNVWRGSFYLDLAMDRLGLDHFLVGELGKRTKFQIKEIAQLTLNVNIHQTRNITKFFTHDCSCLPKDCVLDDENRLPDIIFTEESRRAIPKLNSLQQGAILNTLMFEQKNKPKDNLQLEELQPYIRCLLAQHSVWSIHVSTLLQRSLLEKDSSRSVERSMIQVETLVDNLKTENPSNLDRSYMFHCSYISPSWQLKEHLGNIMMSIGAIQSALDLFLTLDMWEECVACYNAQGLKHKAAEILEKELKSSNLSIAKHILILCLLGDATDNKSFYEEAWKISDYRSSRAQKHLALYYYSRKEYKESIEHFKSSLKINSLQITLWFKLGFAYLVEELWLEAAQAYRKYCDLDFENSEVWNNLAKCYIKTGQTQRAYCALQEAVKHNYENWMIWDNLMGVCVESGFWEETMRCYHRILDLKNKHIDLKVLNILVFTVQNNMIDEDNKPVTNHMECLLKLFGRLTSQVQNDGQIWKLYAHLQAAAPIQNKETADNVLHHLQCAHRYTTQGNKWAQEKTSCMIVIELSLELANAYILCCNKYAKSSIFIKQSLSSAKLMLVSVVSQIENEKQLLTENVDLQEEFEKVKTILKDIQCQLAKAE